MALLFTLLRDTLVFFKNHGRNILWLIMPVIIPLEITNIFLDTLTDNILFNYLLVLLFSTMGYALYEGAFIFYLSTMVSGKQANFTDYYANALLHWKRLFLLAAITSIAVIIGLALLIIPGLIIMIRLSFSEFYLLLGNVDLKNSLMRSNQETQPLQWIIAGGVLLITLITYPLLFLINSLMNEMIASDFAITLLSSILGYIPLLILTIFAFRVFNYHLETHSQ